MEIKTTLGTKEITAIQVLSGHLRDIDIYQGWDNLRADIHDLADQFYNLTLKTQSPTIDDFAALLEDHQRAAYLKRFPDTGPELVDQACAVTIKHGRKYTKVDIGKSGKYMVVNETGEIFGIKAYGVIHRGHVYGTLETIANWQWGGYTAWPAA